jgi:hypothetical protein
MRMLKYTLTVGALLAAATVVTPLHASETMKAIVGSYLEIHAALSADKMDGVKPAAKAIGEQAARMGPAGEAIVRSAKIVEAATDLKSARAGFGDLSDAVIAAGKVEGWKDVPEAKVAYCPMIRKSWVQKDEKIQNPYYGSSMLTCGEIKK